MKDQMVLSRSRETLRISFKKALPELLTLKKKNDHKDFNKLFLKVIPKLKEFAASRVITAPKKNHFPTNMYSANDFKAYLFIETYDNIDPFSSEDEFYIWPYKKAHELLDDVITEEEFDDIFFKNIDDFTQPEWEQLEEKFSTESNGDLIMREDLEDISCYREPYKTTEVFVTDTENSFIEKKDERFHEKEIYRHIAMALHNLSKPMRTVVQLYNEKHLTLAEIATIVKESVEQIGALLKDARKAIEISLFNRYTLD